MIDPDLNVLCCNLCKIALLPTWVAGHIQDNHTNIKVNNHCLQIIIEANDINNDLPSPPATQDGIQPFKGLKVLEGYICPQCPQVSSSTKYLRAHYLKDHSDSPCPQHWSTCKMQQLNNGGRNRRLWRVLEHSIPDQPAITSTDTIVQELRNDIAKVIPDSQFPKDNRLISPWLLTTRWHEHVTGYNVAFLHSLVSIKNIKQCIPAISAATLNYFNEVIGILPATDELVLKKLNSPDPQKRQVMNTLMY